MPPLRLALPRRPANHRLIRILGASKLHSTPNAPNRVHWPPPHLAALGPASPDKPPITGIRDEPQHNGRPERTRPPPCAARPAHAAHVLPGHGQGPPFPGARTDPPRHDALPRSRQRALGRVGRAGGRWGQDRGARGEARCARTETADGRCEVTGIKAESRDALLAVT